MTQTEALFIQSLGGNQSRCLRVSHLSYHPFILSPLTCYHIISLIGLTLFPSCHRPHRYQSKFRLVWPNITTYHKSVCRLDLLHIFGSAPCIFWVVRNIVLDYSLDGSTAKRKCPRALACVLTTGLQIAAFPCSWSHGVCDVIVHEHGLFAYVLPVRLQCFTVQFLFTVPYLKNWPVMEDGQTDVIITWWVISRIN